MSSPTRDKLLAAWRSGELAGMAACSLTLSDMAQCLGLSLDAYRGAAKGIRATGQHFPSWEELRGQESSRGQDFDGEEKTSPSVPGLGTDGPEVGTYRDVDRSIEKPIVSVPYPVAHDFTGSKSIVRKYTEEEMPEGSLVAVLSDIHIPHHDEASVRLVIECCERLGVTHVILNGDIADCGPASRHEGKRRRAMLDEGALIESVEPGKWIYEWARTKKCKYILGNHERWVEDLINESPELRGLAPTALLGLPANHDGWEVLPSKSRLRLGSRCWEHLDGFFPKGNGGSNPGARMKALAPHQTTSGGHLHRKFSFFWTSVDEDNHARTHAAFGNGHLSNTDSHEDYMGTYVNWQKSFELTRVYYVDGRPRFTTEQPEIFTDRYGKPYFEHAGHLYR